MLESGVSGGCETLMPTEDVEDMDRFVANTSESSPRLASRSATPCWKKEGQIVSLPRAR